MVLLAALPFGISAADEPIRSPVMDIEPWGIVDNGHPSGIYYELQDAIARRAGFTPQLTIRPYIRVAAEIKHNVGDFTLMTENPQILAAANKICLLANLDVLILSRAGAPIESMAALNGKKVAVLDGTSHHVPLMTKAKFTVDTVYSTQQQINLLAAGRVDAILGVRQALFYTLRNDKRHLALAEPFSVGQVPAFLWVSRRSPLDWGTRLKGAIESLRMDGEMAAIFNRYQ